MQRHLHLNVCRHFEKQDPWLTSDSLKLWFTTRTVLSVQPNYYWAVSDKSACHYFQLYKSLVFPFSLTPGSCTPFSTHFVTELRVSIQLHPYNDQNNLSPMAMKKHQLRSQFHWTDRHTQTTNCGNFYLKLCYPEPQQRIRIELAKTTAAPYTTAEAGWNHDLLALTMPAQLINDFGDTGPPVLWQPE